MSLSLGAISLLLPALAQGHAFIYYPPMRGGAYSNPDNGYCPQCLGTTDLPMPTCGRYSFLDYAKGPVTNLIAGQRVQFQIKMTAHHKGHFQFRLCDQTMSSAVGDLADQEECLNGHVLERVRPEEMDLDCKTDDSRGDCQPFDEANPSYWYLPPAGGSMSAHYKFTYKLPDGVMCEKCTLQWWWSSANSCTPHPDAYRCYFQKMKALGWNADAWCSGACSFAGSCPASQGAPVLCGEQFKNCADVQITAGSGGTSQTTEQSTATPTPAPEPESEPESEPETAAPTAAPTQATPTPAPEPESEPESEPETEAPTAAPTQAPTAVLTQVPTPTPTPAPSSPSRRRSSTTPATCTVNTALNRGVSQADCDKCPTGYQWWPCNELGPDGDILCYCSGSLLEASGSRREVKEHRFLGLIQRSDEVQTAAWTGEEQTWEFDREEL